MSRRHIIYITEVDPSLPRENATVRAAIVVLAEHADEAHEKALHALLPIWADFEWGTP